jgi:hypothetical protein
VYRRQLAPITLAPTTYTPVEEPVVWYSMCVHVCVCMCVCVCVYVCVCERERERESVFSRANEQSQYMIQERQPAVNGVTFTGHTGQSGPQRVSSCFYPSENLPKGSASLPGLIESHQTPVLERRKTSVLMMGSYPRCRQCMQHCFLVSQLACGQISNSCHGFRS